jgi:predicted Zn finger-like uncharacterized protein
MQIVCPACSKRLQIADDKLPTDRMVRLTCPACQERFSFDSQNHKAPAESPPAKADAPPASLATPSPLATSATSIDITDVGTAPRALVCLDDTSHRDACQKMLPALGFSTIHTPENQAMALAYLSQVPYECFILDAAFDDSTLEANPVLACLHELPMDRRRYTLVALCMPDVITADAMTAYSHSVGLVMRHDDVPTCHRVLEQRLTEHKRLYKVYRELRQQLGKDI